MPDDVNANDCTTCGLWGLGRFNCRKHGPQTTIGKNQMSVSIYWKPVGKGNKVTGGSSLIEFMQKAFKDSLPINLNSDDVGILRGLAACGHSGACELIDAINKNGEITVTAEY